MIIWSPSHVYDLFIAVFVANLYHCYYVPVGRVDLGWCGGLHVEKGGESARWQTTYLDVVAVSCQRDGLFVPEGSHVGSLSSVNITFRRSLLCPPFAT